jgi:monoamine oxidase
MKRRTLLKQASLAMLAVLTVRTNPLAAAPRARKVLIIGAGIAGLAAARWLTARGHEVQVVEARTRIGGRLWTSSAWPDVPLDLGASWIHGLQDNPLTALAEEIDAQLISTSYARTLTLGSDGQAIDAEQQQSLDDWQKRLDQAIQNAQQGDRDLSLRRAVEEQLDWDELDEAEQRLVRFLLNSTIEQEYAGSSDQLSAHAFDSIEEFDGDDAIFAEGYQVIVKHLGKNLRIELGQVVQEIDWSEPQVRVLTAQGEFSADQVIISVPLGVLQSGQIGFSPPLPQNKGKAIEHLGMGHFNKCYLRFAQAFWPRETDWLEFIPPLDEDGQWVEWVSLLRPTGQPILLGFNAADFAHEIESWSDAQIVDSAMARLRDMFGAEIPEPIGYQLTRWGQDPFARGAYSFNKLGSTPAMRDDLAASLDGRLFFAGEATSRQYFATVHGAYLSGLAAATQLDATD